MTTMLYKVSEEEKPRKQKILGMNLDYIVVEDSEIDEHLDDGWKSLHEVKEIYDEMISLEDEDEEEINSNELDENGYPWDGRINTKDRSKTKKGSWKIKPGTKKAILDAVRDEIKPVEEVEEEEKSETDEE